MKLLDQTISLFKLETEKRISELMSYSREEMERDKLDMMGEDKTHGVHYIRATEYRSQAAGLREAINRIDNIIHPNDPFRL